MSVRFAALAPAAALLLAGVTVLAAAAGADPLPQPKTPAEHGQLYGLALAAAEFCPGGIVTDKGKAYAAEFKGADGDVFNAEATKIVEAWRLGTKCPEIEMDRQQLAMCRTAHLRNCRAAWIQLGPDGSVRPGFIDTDYSKLDSK